ncbi:MAG: hypothetical protein ACLFPA_13255, partial [Dichotomicrobium sp.]
AEYDLSTWKGGGMGMFAGADNSATRYSQVFIEAADGQRYPLLKLTSKQQKLLDDAHLYPLRENFVPVANSIRATKWADSGPARPVRIVDSKNEFIRETDRTYTLLLPFGERAPGENTNFSIVFENYQLHYDVEKSLLTTIPLNSFKFDMTE